MTPETIRQKVCEVLSRKLKVPPSSIKGTSRLRKDLGLDSFGGIELIFDLEDALGFKMDEEDIDEHSTVDDVVACIATRVAKTPPRSS